ncbi:uncharacterized protein LOC111407016 [Olea europaea var. sylvestris]|uniref:HMG box domain-containing protein n=1 Tax=Olea europaea subsp. europaea TaxID=158383 RepID=A0A8S0RGQ2_OLEEU|nr:uncharacterized protein LOC111407016 [Olea europaea var. sylvestris]CAA2978808.1 Hypothetical predicted protein [Olea europaea subsp. europaea]
MVSQPRARKRVHSIPRGPDGSAFQKCEKCGLLVAIALTDMHECEIKKLSTKKLKSQFGIRNSNGLKIQYQPRSAFRLFIEKLLSTSKDGNEIEVDRKGFDIWKKMSKEERIPFVLQAEKINSAYVKLLLEEENEIEWVDDEADSAEIGRRHDKNYDKSEMHYDSERSSGFHFFWSKSLSFKREDLLRICPWATEKSPRT